MYQQLLRTVFAVPLTAARLRSDVVKKKSRTGLGQNKPCKFARNDGKPIGSRELASGRRLNRKLENSEKALQLFSGYFDLFPRYVLSWTYIERVAKPLHRCTATAAAL